MIHASRKEIVITREYLVLLDDVGSFLQGKKKKTSSNHQIIIKSSSHTNTQTRARPIPFFVLGE